MGQGKTHGDLLVMFIGRSLDNDQALTLEP